jgi:hypothetical protein
MCPEYRNEIDTVASFYSPGAGSAMADDASLAGTARHLVHYDVSVYGGFLGGGPFDVTGELYTDCPGDGGTPIPGTAATWTDVPDDGYLYIVSADLSASPVPLPDTVWAVLSFSTGQAGWVLAGPAENGSSGDVFGQDDPPWGCTFSFDGNPPSYAGFWVNLQCTDGTAGRSAAAPVTTSISRLPAGRTQAVRR